MKNVFAVIGGYLCLFVAVFLSLSAAYLVFGTERAFQPGSYKTSFAWCVVSLLLGLPAAWLGGWVCGKIARSAGAVTALAVVVGVLGVALAVSTLAAQPTTEPRPATVANFQAMAKAQTPPWVAFLNPALGIVGVLLGGRVARRSNPAHPRQPSVAPQAAGSP